VFHLSEGEQRLLLAAGVGEGLFFAGKNHVAIQVVASEWEDKVITTNPEQLLKIKQGLDTTIKVEESKVGRVIQTKKPEENEGFKEALKKNREASEQAQKIKGNSIALE